MELRGVFRYSSEILRQVGILITGSLAVVALMQFVIGMQCATEANYVLRGYGASAYSGVFTAWCGVREMGPYMWGYIISAKVGCGLVAELGSMRINNEFDAMESLGININLSPEAIARCIAQVGVGFMFAPNHHPAMKNVAPVRKELGIKTIFNILGPLTNPAGAPNILMGVFHPDLVGIQVRALQRLGAEHALVVYGKDGMDEVSLGASTLVGELKYGEVTEYEIHPEDFGLTMASTRAIKVETPEESRAMLLGVLEVIKNNDRKLAQHLQKMDDTVDELYSDIKYYLTKISREALSENEGHRWTDIISFTITWSRSATSSSGY